MERTGNPPPRNATWLRQYFPPRTEMLAPLVRKSPTRHLAVDDDDLTSGTLTPDFKAQAHQVYRNARGQRVDLPKTWNLHPPVINGVRDRERRLCNAYYLVGNCTKIPCPYDHDSVLDDDIWIALLYVSRSQPCPEDSYCNLAPCIKGHMCPNGRICKYGNNCRFAHLHGMDTTVVD